jgi:hypothetical protein
MIPKAHRRRLQGTGTGHALWKMDISCQELLTDTLVVVQARLKEANHQERIALAWALHRKTNQSQAWTAEALGLCSAANVSQQVR